MKIDAAVSLLAALAHDCRLRAFRKLVAAGPGGLSAGALARELRVAPATLSFHLKELAAAGLIRARPEGQFIFYSASFPLMNDLVRHLTENCCGGTECELTRDAPKAARTARVRRAA
jgi:ArsR family transcriptional regulator, arsenate/arsenite/antimonite-responsive transcriptional repressor